MKKIIALATVALLIGNITFANGGGKKKQQCGKAKTEKCCTKTGHKTCCDKNKTVKG